MNAVHVVPGVEIMVGRWKRHAVWFGVACMVACMAAMLPTSSAYAVTPTQPSFNDPFVWVSDVGEVSAQWDASIDTSGHAINYTLYRDIKPITAISIGVSPTMQVVIDNFTGTSYTAVASAQEMAQSYVWYYAVRARATVTAGVYEYSLPSKSAAPNMHGYPADSKNTVTCDRCHNVHGAYGDVDYRSVGLCYSCHAGATSALPGLRSSINVKADFFEYADQTAGSQHVMSNDARRCSACHSPHRSPWYYDIAGVYQPTNSFRDMLRIQTGVNASGKPTYTYTSRNDDTAENITSCMLCHGASSTNIAYVGGASAYGDTAGDHNSAGYATAAHGPAVVLGNESDTSQPQIQCLACHDNHASSLDKLIAYRKNSSGLGDAVDLCYSCHSQSSGETRVVGSNAPFSWNGRDVQAQFAKHSRHPTSVPVGDSVPVSASWSQTTLTDFTADTRTHVSVVAGGSGTSGAMQLESIYNTGITFLTEGFEDATWTTDFPTSSGEWATSTAWSPGGSYSLRATGGNTNPDVRTSRVLNLAGTSNVIVSFRWQRVGLDAGEYMRIQYSTDGSTWTDGWSTQGNGNTVNDGGAPDTFQIPSPTATTYIRLVLDNVSSTSEYGYWDDIIVTGDQFSGYENVGTAVSTAIPTGAGTVTTWGNLTYSASQPSGTQVAVDVLDGANGSVLLSGVSSGTSLGALSAGSLKLRARLTGDAALPSTVTPRLDEWAVAYEWLPAPTSGQLICMSCHNVHSVGKGTGAVWDMTRVSDPDNTKLAFSGSPTQFCLRCHDGGAPSAASTATKLVPYDVGLSAVASPLFPGWNKNAADVQFTSGAHSATTIAQLAGEFGCETCHDPHASDNDRLTALTAVGSGGASMGHLNVRRDNSTTYAEQNLCYACHAPGRAGSCTGCHGVSMGNLEARTAFQATYRHPVETTGRHSDTETAADLGPSNRHAECADCHDPHAAKAGLHVAGSSKPGEVLRGAFGVRPTGAWPANWTAVPAAGWTAERMTGETTDYEAYVCFKCHSSYSGQPFTAQSGGVNYTSSDVAREFNPSNASYHNVLGQSVGMKTSFEVQLLDGSTQNVTWALPATLDIFKAGSGLDRDSMLTCTSCHINSSTITTQAKGPHGSSVKWLLDAVYPTEWKTTSLSTGTLGMSNSTNICAKCHDLNGASGNWSNDAHADSNHRGTYGECNTCHIAIPHGWKRPRLLGYTSDGIYATDAQDGQTGIRVGSHTASSSSVSWSMGDCAALCGEHSTSFDNSILWP